MPTFILLDTAYLNMLLPAVDIIIGVKPPMNEISPNALPSSSTVTIRVTIVLATEVGTKKRNGKIREIHINHVLLTETDPIRNVKIEFNRKAKDACKGSEKHFPNNGAMVTPPSAATAI